MVYVPWRPTKLAHVSSEGKAEFSVTKLTIVWTCNAHWLVIFVPTDASTSTWISSPRFNEPKWLLWSRLHLVVDTAVKSRLDARSHSTKPFLSSSFRIEITSRNPDFPATISSFPMVSEWVSQFNCSLVRRCDRSHAYVVGIGINFEWISDFSCSLFF